MVYKTLILTNYSKECIFFCPNFLIFQILSRSKKLNLDHFQQLLFHTFPLPINYIFLVLLLMPRISIFYLFNYKDL